LKNSVSVIYCGCCQAFVGGENIFEKGASQFFVKLNFINFSLILGILQKLLWLK